MIKRTAESVTTIEVLLKREKVLVYVLIFLLNIDEDLEQK